MRRIDSQDHYEGNVYPEYDLSSSPSRPPRTGLFVAASLALALGVVSHDKWIPKVENAYANAMDKLSNENPPENLGPQTEFASSGMYFNLAGVNQVQVSPEKAEEMESCGNYTDRILLTFDDYGSYEQIHALTDILTQNNVGAIFFPNNNYVSSSIAEELRQMGFWVGNHTYDHANLHKMGSVSEIEQAISSGIDSDLFRPPFGASYSHNGQAHFDARALEAANNTGDRICLWEIDTMDWDGTSTQAITNKVLSSLEPGAVVLMHMQDSYNTLDALPGIISGIHSAGYELCALQQQPTTADIPDQLPC